MPTTMAIETTTWIARQTSRLRERETDASGVPAVSGGVASPILSWVMRGHSNSRRTAGQTSPPQACSAGVRRTEHEVAHRAGDPPEGGSAENVEGQMGPH